MKLIKNGFTMIELLVAIGLFAILVPSLALGIRNLTAMNNRARDLALSSLIAEGKIELLRSTGFNSIPIGTVDFSSELPGELGNPKNASYTVASPSPGIKSISLTITYRDNKKTTTRTYQTLISELGVAQ